MWNSGATQRWVGVDGVVRLLHMSGRSGAMRRAAIAMVALLAGVFAAPVAAQSTTVSITGANRPSFSRAGQPLTFYVQLSAGNAEIAGLTFTSGSPSGMSAVNCPSLPVAVNATTTCTFTYTTTDMDVAMGKVTALGRWRATRTGAAARSGSTNTVELGYAPPRAPDAPTVVTATASDGKAVVNFAAPFDGGYPIDDYTVTSQPDGITATGANGPITVNGLTNGVTYRFAITARSTMGASAASASSNAVTPKAAQTIDFQNPGAQNFGTSLTLYAWATSSLDVSFSSGTTSVCTITSTGALTYLSAGTCTIHADQAGDTVYDPAPRVSQSFAVNAVLPDAPTIGTATAGDTEATVAFTPPASNGGSAITNYTVTAYPGGNTATGTTSPIRITGLTNIVVYNFTVTAENSAGAGSQSAYSNDVVPNAPPQVTSVAVPADGLYGPGQNLDFTVTWDQFLAITGTPQIAVTIGSTTVQATYLMNPTASTAVFRYTVLAGQMDANGITVGALSLNGGSIANLYGTPAQLTLNSVGSTAGVLVGTNNQAPVNTVPGARSVTENDTLNFGNTISIDDADADSAQVQVTLSVSNGVLSLTSPAGLTFAVGDGSNDATMTFNGTLTNINAALDGLRFTPTTGYYGPASLQITTNDLGNTGFGGAKTDTDTVAITVVPLDNTPPVVSAIALVDASPTNATTVAFDVTFSEPVISVTVSDFTLVGTNGTTGSAAGLVTSDNIRYRITVTGVSGSGTLRLNLNANSGITDAAGNAAPGYTAGPAYSIDQAGAQIDSVATPAAGQYIAGQTLTFQVTFDENVTVAGTPSLPLTLDVGGAREATYVSGSGSNTLTFHYTVVAGDHDLDGPVFGNAVVSNGGTIADAAGNAASLTLNNVGNTSGIVVGQLAQAITGFAATPTTPTFAPNGTFTVAATGGASGLPVVFASTTTSVCTVAGNTVTMLAAGTCSLTADQAGNANYSAAPRVTLDIAIGTATQAVTNFVANPTAPVFAPNGTFTVSATPGVSTSAVVFGSTTTSVCTVNGSTVTMLSAGTCSLTADQAGDGNYNAAPQLTLDVAISAATQVITGFTATPSAPVFAPNGTFALAAVGGASGNPVTFASTTPALCTVAGNVVTMQAAGTCALTADQAGTNDYVAAAQVALQVVIGRATPTLSWLGEMSRVVGEAAFDLPDPGSDSRGAFTFTSSNPAVATVSGRRVTIVGAGVTTLVATQAADGNYAQGTVSATLTVTDRPDPTKDASVAGGLQAQVDASVRFAAAQLSNIQGRLREQRFSTANHSRNDLTFAMASRSGGAVSMSAEQFASMETAHLPTGLAVWSAGAITSGGRDEGDSDFQSDGVTVGADWRFNDRLLFGVAGGWGWDDTDLDDARSRLDAQQRAVSMYGLWRPAQRWFVDGIVGWGELDFDIRRHSDVADATATAARSGDQAFGSLTAGYEHGGGIGMTLTGYGRLDASRTTLDAYREQGLGIYDLAYGSQTVENSGASLGVEGSFPILTPRGSAFRPYWMLEYRETLENRSDVELNYVVLPVDGGYVLGMRGYGDNALTYGGGIDMELARGWKLSLLGRRQHADGQRPSSTFGLLLSFSPAAASAATFRDDAVDATQPQDAAKP
ncbi:autotransporter domain-containing protein [Lysobacter soli]|uniref:autotransporter domain-containing protein n=1 Tax=Lysobacter soli TaxID=453783 RepID=UPI00240F04BB|nr:autotransporter domain-containing protein [Lysobacter soli]MDG2519318.1 autotransporter domain-containing protein [Lysobacter soli]